MPLVRALILVLVVVASCGPIPPSLPPTPPAPAPTMHDVTWSVTDARTGQPVADATLTVDPDPGTGAMRTTDGSGFAHVGARGGTYQVRLEHPGYVAWSDTLTVAAPRHETVALQPDTPPVPPTRRGRLQVRARAMTYPDGEPFPWRGVTAFSLLEQLAGGRAADAVAYLRWAHDTGFTVVRVLGMLPAGWMVDRDFTAAEGLAAWPRLMALAREHDVYVQIVALANTAATTDDDLGVIVERYGQACADDDGCALIEIANEPWHSTQRSDVHDPAQLERWASRVPAGVPVALGAAQDDESHEMAAAPVITVHLERPGPGGRDPWNAVRRVRELEMLSADTGRYIVDNEPIGAGEFDEPGRRYTDPDLACTAGVLGRVFGVGSTFHLDAGLMSKLPGPAQRTAAAAFIECATLWPTTVPVTFSNASWADSPVARARWAEGSPQPDTTVRAYSAVAGDRGWTVLVGVWGDPGLEWQHGWTPGQVLVDRARVRVLAIGR